MLDDLERLEREGLNLSSLQKRGWAFLIDEFIISIIFFIIFWEAVFASKDLESISYAINSLMIYLILLKIIYQTFFVYYYGATPGKMLLKIEVVEENDFQTPSFLISLNRAVGRIISEMLFYLGFAWAFLDPKRQAWHDKLAKTLVVDV